jgi:D-alanyl-D-alanine carboxypeptidase
MAIQDRHGGSWRRFGVAGLAGALAIATYAAALPAHATGKSAVLVLDANTGRVLHASAADEPRHPASLAKMMTIYMAFELIEQGRLSYQTKIKISANAASAAPTKLDLADGDEIALIDAIKALITKSANDVAVAIAEHIAGSEEKFAKLMTQKAHQLGMPATIFRNASGLPDDEQVTTARDMVTLALHLQDDFPKHYPLFATRAFTYKDETLHNHNTLLKSYEGTDGIKTGYTRASGFNLVASVRRGRKHVVGAIFGGSSAATRNAATRTFLNMGLVKASSEKTRQPAPLLVAQARPAPERKVGSVPTPQRVARPAAQVATTAAALPAMEPSAQQAPEPQRSPAIEMARVRSVLVTPRGANPASDPLPLRGSTAPGFEDVLARVEQSAERPVHPPADQSASRMAWTTASAGGSSMNIAATAPGAPPSTLEAQAANLARGEPPVAAPSWQQAIVPSRPAAAARKPVEVAAAPVAPASAAAGSFHIQIGAYQSQAEAEKRLASARELAPGLLANRTPITTQFKQGDKVFFRARYAGFESKAAASACTELKKLKIDCLVMKSE